MTEYDVQGTTLIPIGYIGTNQTFRTVPIDIVVTILTFVGEVYTVIHGKT